MDQVLSITGIPRSGSTLVYQICRQIIIDKKSKRYRHPANSIFRSHRLLVPGETWNKNIIVCLRDPRDAILSFSKLRFNGKRMNLNEWLKSLVDTTTMYKEKDRDGYHIFRYEFFYPDNLIEMYKEICSIMDSDFDVDYYNELIQKFSLENALNVSMSLGDFSKINNDNMLHGQHVTNSGKIGGWKTELSQDLLELVNPYLKELGYA